jgi:hypothetical protein
MNIKFRLAGVESDDLCLQKEARKSNSGKLARKT